MTSARNRIRLPKLQIVEPVGRTWDRLPWWGKSLVFIAMLALAWWYPTTLDRSWQSVLFFPVGVYILLALGLNIVVGLTGLLDLGYVAFFAVAPTPPPSSRPRGARSPHGRPCCSPSRRPWPPAWPSARPTLRLRGDYLAIVTLGFGEIVRISAQNSASLGEARGITGIPHPSSIGGTEFGTKPLPYYHLVLVAIVIVILLVARMKRSRVGRSWAAIREDEDAAELMGVPDLQDEAVVVRHGCGDRRLGGVDLRHQGRVHQPGHVPVHPLDPGPRRRGARRPRVDPGRHRRRLRGRASSPSTSATPAARAPSTS